MKAVWNEPVMSALHRNKGQPTPCGRSVGVTPSVELRLLPELSARRRASNAPPHPAIVEVAKAIARMLAREDDEKELAKVRKRKTA